MPTGDLEWAPEPFEYKPGKVLRYIDFENGSDQNDGATKDAPWKHHPWDPAATAKAKAGGGGVATYVFKQGATYRGNLVVPDGASGTEDSPIRLTRDPAWGEGEARIYGSRQITGGWQQGAGQADIPNAEKVWWIDLDTAPRTAWVVDGSEITRLHIARDPNWTVSDPQDPMSEWYVWDNPKWWTGANQKKIDGKPYHWCTDTDVLKDGEDLTGATVWTQWMPVMSSPYPHPIIEHDRKTGAIAFGGPWVHFAHEGIWTGCRYYLEDRPQWLDSPGEMWFDKKGDGGRLYVRLPDDADPNRAVIEIGEHETIIDATELRHVHISGLSFRFTDWFYDFPGPQWYPSREAKQLAVIRLNGAGENIAIRHNTFEQVHQALRMVSPAEGLIASVVVADNAIRHTDHGAVFITTSKGPSRGSLIGHGKVDDVAILRNLVLDSGMRVLAGEHGNTIWVHSYRAHIAGNMIERTGGWGININGFHLANGQAGDDIPYSRYLVHHNKVTDSLLKSSDLGAFYITNHGGPAYLYSNIADNPVGNRRAEDERLGMAYYLDGAYKCYLFNNLAIGHDHQGEKSLMNKNALKSMVSFQNTFFNNTIYRWANASDRQSPQGNREKYIGNIFSDIEDWVFYHNKAQKSEAEANAAHEVHADAAFRYETMAYSHNVIHDFSGEHVGVFEQSGMPHADIDALRGALTAKHSLASEIGFVAEEPVLADPAQGDFRPRPGSAAIDRAARVFVPWTLARTVAEWHFRPRADDPTVIEDEHWFQTAYYVDRGMYHTTPRYPLLVEGATREDFTTGPLEDWIAGALVLAEADTAVLAQTVIAEPFTYAIGNGAKRSEQTVTAEDKQTVDIHDSDLIIECHLQTNDANGIIAVKIADKVGYQLEIADGAPRLLLRDQNGTELSATGSAALADGGWHHLLVEVDRDAGVRMYLDGAAITVDGGDRVPQGSLRNAGDFVVGKQLACTIEFMRVARATLAEAQTSIKELYAWQFDGPQFRDFAGRQPAGAARDAGALESAQ